MYIHIYTYIYIHIYTHIHIHIYVHTYLYKYIYIHNNGVGFFVNVRHIFFVSVRTDGPTLF